jgi:hypothetical protein
MEIPSRKEKIIASVLFIFSVIYLLACLKIAGGRIGNPGPGLIPRLIATILFFFTGLNVFRTFRRHGGTSPPKKGSEVNYTAVIGLAIVVLSFPFLLHTFKAIVAIFISSFAMLRFMHYKTVLKCLIISLILSASIYVIFVLILRVTVPSGPLEHFFFRFSFLK